MSSSFEITCLSFSDEGTFSVRACGKPWKQLIDVHENSGLNRQKKTLQRRVLLVTVVIMFAGMLPGPVEQSDRMLRNSWMTSLRVTVLI